MSMMTTISARYLLFSFVLLPPGIIGGEIKMEAL
jgi:hypothetical protein